MKAAAVLVAMYLASSLVFAIALLVLASLFAVPAELIMAAMAAPFAPAVSFSTMFNIMVLRGEVPTPQNVFLPAGILFVIAVSAVYFLVKFEDEQEAKKELNRA